MCKISVVMATYNGEKYIEEQLASIYKQSCPPDEVIIRDDCSTDNTCEVIRKFIENNHLDWVLVSGEKNLGFERNFTEALKLSTGDVIFLSDQDDVWHRDKIKNMSSVMNRYKQILCLNSSFVCIDSEGRRIPSKHMPFTSNNGLIIGKIIKKHSLSSFSAEEVLRYNISMGCTTAFRKELLNEFFLNAGEVPHDWLINVIAAQRGGLFFYNKELIKYRLHSNNTIGQDNRFIQEIESRDKLYKGIIKDYLFFQHANLIKSNDMLRNICREMKSFYKIRRKIIRNEFTVRDLRKAIRIKHGLPVIFLLRDYCIRFCDK